MAQTEHYNFWYLDPDEEISDFPNTWNYNVDKFDAAIYDAATNAVTVGRVPNLPASKTTSGEFAQARIPNLPASKTTSGTFADARIPDSIARTADLGNASKETGLRDITDNADVDVDSGKVLVCRSGNMVIFSLNDAKFESSGTVKIIDLPTGFRPMFDPMRELVFDKDLDTSYITVYKSGSTWLAYAGSTDEKSVNAMWITSDSWPSTLPGNPA